MTEEQVFARKQNMTDEQKHQDLFKLIIMTSLTMAGLILANIVAVKIISIGPFNVPAGIFLFAMVFLCTDIITEGWGKRIGHKVVIAGFVANAVVVLYIRLAMWFTPAPFYMFNEEFKLILGGNLRIVVTGMLVYLISQNLDVFLYSKVRKLMKGKHLWVRNTTTTLISQAVDSTLFVTGAFYGIVPTEVLPSMIIPTIMFKWMLAVADTPLCYLGRWWIKKSWPPEAIGIDETK